MYAASPAKPAHALARVPVRLRALAQSWPSATGCQTASRKKSSFSRLRVHARCVQTSTTPKQNALFPVASVSGALVLRFPGQYADDEAGNFYNYFRSYDSKTGRYTQNDPIGLQGGLNRFGYVEGNPISNIDPTGLETYICKRPLGGAPGSYAPPLLNHTYVCVGSGANMTCGSTTASSGGALSNIFGNSAGKPTTSATDYYKPEACEQRQGADSCIETCVANELKNPSRPKYGVGPSGTDCQEYTENVVSTCEKRCVRR